ncbi:Rieske 2Fe-2S domain-containing protein [PVC group bacterium]|nr:Rieske 2Fe-2S domain-containing protein [PVC group bacterium]
MKALAKTSDIPEGKAIKVDACDREIAIFRYQGQFHAINAVCPHNGGPLYEGAVDNWIVTCPWHEWQFDIRSGRAPKNIGRVTCYPIEIKDGTIYLLDPEKYDDVSRLK